LESGVINEEQAEQQTQAVRKKRLKRIKNSNKHKRLFRLLAAWWQCGLMQ